MTPVSEPWAEFGNWISVQGDPTISGNKLHLTFDDVVIKASPIYSYGYCIKFVLDGSGGNFIWIWQEINLGFPTPWPAINFNASPAQIGGAGYGNPFTTFGTFAGQTLASEVVTVGIYLKGNSDGTGCSIACRVNDGTSEYASGFVSIAATNSAQALVGSNTGGGGAGACLVGPLEGFQDVTPAEVDAIYAVSVLADWNNLGGAKSFAIGDLGCLVRQWPRSRIIPGFKYNGKPMANGNYRASDRGASQDIYETDVVFYGTEEVINTLQETLEENRESVNLTGFSDYIFAPIVDHTVETIVATITTQNLRKMKAFAGETTGMWELAVTFQIVENPALSYPTPSLSGLVLQMESEQDKTFTSMKSRTYEGEVGYQDLNVDSGVFRAKFIQTTAQAQAMIAYFIVTARSGIVSFPTIGGVAYPFGIVRGALPKSCNILEFSFTRLNFMQWEIGFTAVESF